MSITAAVAMGQDRFRDGLDLVRPVVAVRHALLLFVEQVIGSVRHEHLVADIRRRRATVRRRRSPGCIQPLDKRCIRQDFAAGGTLLGTNCRKQEAGNGACIRTARVGSCCNSILLRVQDRRPDLTAIKRTLPRRAAERQRDRSSVVRVGIGAEKMRDDLECLPEDGLEQSCFGPSALDRPGRRRRPRSGG